MHTLGIVPLISPVHFYLGQGRVPEALRIPALLAGGVLLPIFAIVYWMWRIRVRPSVRGYRVSVAEAA